MGFLSAIRISDADHSGGLLQWSTAPWRYFPPSSALAHQIADSAAMDKDIEAQAGRIVALEAELESAGEVSLAQVELERLRLILHDWVESVAAVVASPGVGRVTLIHADGSQSGITSRSLPFLMTRPARFD
jgi:hypothetical protein